MNAIPALGQFRESASRPAIRTAVIKIRKSGFRARKITINTIVQTQGGKIQCVSESDSGTARHVLADPDRLGKSKARENVMRSRAFLNNPGDFLLSHTVTRAVPSAPTGLTSVFGMGTGVTLSTKSPEKRWI